MSEALGTLLTVCLTLSSGLALDDHGRAAMLAEAQAVWQAHRVILRQKPDDACDRLILVKSDTEIRPEDAAPESALGWVPFVAGNARRLVFLRASRAHALVAEMSPGPGPEGLTRLLAAKLLGRVLAHELGHVLLNSMKHTPKGLMRAHFRARDVLSALVSTYTLAPAERTVLFARAGRDVRLAAR